MRYMLHHTIFPLQITDNDVLVWCDAHTMTNNYADGHATFRRDYGIGDTMPVPLRSSGTTLAEVAESAVKKCEERGFRAHHYLPIMDHGISVMSGRGKSHTLHHKAVAIIRVLEGDAMEPENKYGSWWSLGEVYDYIEYCWDEDKGQILAYLRWCNQQPLRPKGLKRYSWFRFKHSSWLRR